MAAFTPGNIVVYSTGTGTDALGSAATAAANGANQMLTASGSATSEGLLNLSADGRYLLLTGYDAALDGSAQAREDSSRFVNGVLSESQRSDTH